MAEISKAGKFPEMDKDVEANVKNSMESARDLESGEVELARIEKVYKYVLQFPTTVDVAKRLSRKLDRRIIPGS